MYIEGSPATFKTDSSKVIFLASYLRGQAYKWFEPLLKKQDEVLDNYKKFCEAFTANHGDPDHIRTTTKRLQTLTQTASAAAYTTTFLQLSSFLSWNDEALRAQFYSGLKDDVKDAMATCLQDPASLKELAELAIRLDNRLHERRLSKKTANFAPRAPSFVTRRSPTTPPSAGNADGPQPMDLDATPRGRFKPLTREEREDRIRRNLCLYCGKPEHRIKDCPEIRRYKAPSRVQGTTQEDHVDEPRFVFEEVQEDA